MTDDSPVYPAIGRQFAGHGSVNHSIEEYVRAQFWHTNTVENFFSIFKRGVFGCYFHVSEAHLHRYAAEFDIRFPAQQPDRARDRRFGARGSRPRWREGQAPDLCDVSGSQIAGEPPF